MVDVRVPTRLSARQRELLEEFAVRVGERDERWRRRRVPAASRGRRKRGLATD